MSWGGLEQLGSVTVYDRTPKEEIISRIGDADAILTNKTPISKETLAACPSVKYIGVLATGYNVVDTQAAKERGIPVCNIPTYGTAAVGQFARITSYNVCYTKLLRMSLRAESLSARSIGAALSLVPP